MVGPLDQDQVGRRWHRWSDFVDADLRDLQASNWRKIAQNGKK